MLIRIVRHVLDLLWALTNERRSQQKGIEVRTIVPSEIFRKSSILLGTATCLSKEAEDDLQISSALQSRHPCFRVQPHLGTRLSISIDTIYIIL